jgi:hypothetical protein
LRAPGLLRPIPLPAAIKRSIGSLAALWLVWGALALFGFCSSCKAAVERITQRSLDRRRRRRMRQAEPRFLPVSP